MGGGGGLCRVTGPLRSGWCIRMSGTCVTRVTCAGCATLTPRRGGVWHDARVYRFRLQLAAPTGRGGGREGVIGKCAATVL